ncbi:MAG: efflux RND transporter periplasmic adaptor subunit [Actinobacteria bacterium]|nr:MAG: efflux RND transporter periplasmic adaptor subunit [Actinomycetota bacterium]
MVSKITRKIFFITTITIITITALLNLSACKRFGEMQESMETFKVTRGDIIQTVTTSGYVDSSVQNDYSLPASGKVIYALNKGDIFSKGDVLIEIDNSRQELLITQAEENLNTAYSSLELAKISYQQALDANHIAVQLAQENANLSEQSAQNALTALEDANRSLSLIKKEDLSTDLQLAQAVTQSHSAEGAYEQTLINQSTTYWSNLSSTQSAAIQIEVTAKNIEQAETQLKLSEINLKLAKLDMDSSIIRAPYDGIVLSSVYKEGQYASPGINAISIISDDFIIKADINEIDVVNLQVGQDVDIRLDAYYENELSGKIINISPISSNIGGVVSYELTVKPETGNGPELLYGLSASLTITTSGVENVLFVPIQSVYEEDGKSYVDFVAEDGGIEKTEVTTGIFNYDFIEIKSGLNEGDTILISPAQYNIPGSLEFKID